MGKTVIRNIGCILSGEVEAPTRPGNTVVLTDRRISQIGREEECDTAGADRRIDARGTVLCPGLIDAHIHPVFGDFTPRQNALGFIESALHGGVTTMVSNGEAHLPGRPRDVAGVKALALLAAKSFRNARPGGVKVHGGTLIVEAGLREEDLAEVAREGVERVKFLTEITDLAEARRMSVWAKKYGLKVLMHCGGASLPGVGSTSAESIIQVQPDIVAHINGGPTPVPLADMYRLVRETPFAVEIVACGNPGVAVKVVQAALEIGALSRVTVGTDSPSGFGVMPLGVLQVIGLISSFTDLLPAQAVALATGNAARLYGWDVGRIREGAAADLVLMDAPVGGAGEDALESLKMGDMPGISLVMIDGEIAVAKSRNTPPAQRPWVME